MTIALVTGVTGQDGGYLAEQLVAQNCQVHGLVRDGEGTPVHITALGDRVVLHAVDLLAPRGLEAVVEAVQPDEVYNLVGVSSVAQSWQEPELTARVNGEVAVRLLHAAWELTERGKSVRVLQASSGEIFAGSGVCPQDESTEIAPQSPYGASKAFAHHMGRVYRSRGLHVVNAILYNHESPRRPPTFVTRKISRAVASIVRGSGEQLKLGALDVRRDWGWAPEYVQGMVLALRHHSPEDFILATGRSSTVQDFVTAAFAHVGIPDWQKHVRTDEGLVRPVDAPELVGNPGKAERELGWSARVGLSELVGRMVDADLDETPA